MRFLLAFCALLAVTHSVHAQSRKPRDVSSQAPWEAVVGYCEGEGTVQRNQAHYRLVRGSGIRFDDILDLADGGRLSVAFLSGTNITVLGPARVALRGDSTSYQLQVQAGEIRVVHAGQTQLQIEAADAGYALGRSIFRLKKTGRQTAVELEAGVAAIITADGLQPLKKQLALVTKNSGRPEVAGQVDWGINASEVRLAAAMQTAPQLGGPSSTNSPSGTSTQPGQNPLGQNPLANNQGTTQPQNNAPVGQQPPLPEDDEEPRIAQAPAPASALRGGDAGIDASQGLGLPSFSGSSSLSLGSFSGSSGGFSSGGLFADAGQQTFQGQVTADNSFPQGSPFPGSIHLVTTEQKYGLDNVQLNASEQSKIGGNNYYSIGMGPAPTGQVVTDASTGTLPMPTTLPVTQFDAHVVKLDQYGVPDPAIDPTGLDSNIGITGLAGAVPTGPAIVGTAPLIDNRANFQKSGNATFALGEFRVAVGTSGNPEFYVRRSDQDRLIVKDLNGNDANDMVTPNSDVNFKDDAVDPRFLPQSPTVVVPVSLDRKGTSYSSLSFLRRSAFTNVVADTLHDYSRRTGQTRFVVDGKIVDISGYQPAP